MQPAKLSDFRVKSATITAQELLKHKISPNPCAQCPNFGRRWACPPFEHSPIAEVFPNFDALLYAVEIPSAPNLSAQESTEAARKVLDPIFYEMEQDTPQSLLLLAGSCICPLSENCPRNGNKPCAYPDRMRASLESLGFNVVELCRKFLDTEILWQSPDGTPPPYYTLVYSLLLKTREGAPARRVSFLWRGYFAPAKFAPLCQ